MVTYNVKKWWQRVHQWLSSFLIPWLKHQVIKKKCWKLHWATLNPKMRIEISWKFSHLFRELIFLTLSFLQPWTAAVTSDKWQVHYKVDAWGFWTLIPITLSKAESVWSTLKITEIIIIMTKQCTFVVNIQNIWEGRTCCSHLLREFEFLVWILGP